MDKLSYLEMKALEKLERAQEIQEASEKLLDHFTASVQWLLHYSKKYNIPLPESEALSKVVNEAIELADRLPDTEDYERTTQDSTPERDTDRFNRTER